MTAAIDNFARSLFDQAKAHLEASRNAKSAEPQAAYLHAALLLGFCALEAHLSSIAEDFYTRADLTLLDQSILLERKLELINGEYQLLPNELKMFRLEDRIEYLFAKFSTKPLETHSTYWGEFKLANKLRNKLTHPKTQPTINVSTVERALKAILELLNAAHKGIYGAPYPIYNLGLNTALVLSA
ncbi:MAG TPA: hypothetical protein VKC61_00965 [Pyrinomonadaceae bacterium]|nr:hypothetical protein [Pyrinomonadaceae bacterium]